ncbi:MAG: hypothetical protein U0V74_17595 [Chitinophagales bacterium]
MGLNDKAVSPKGESALGIIPVSTQEFTVSVSKTLVTPAQNVMIRDEINSNIDLTTVKVTGYRPSAM